MKLLAAVDSARQVFGASEHGYEPAPPLTNAELIEFEARVGGDLPADYRAYVTEISAHGVGPYYGLVADPELIVLEGQPKLLALAEQGCGGRSVLVLDGPQRGRVLADWTREGGEVSLEAESFIAWYSTWLDRALVEWMVENAVRIALDGPELAVELEAVAHAFDLVAQRTQTSDSTVEARDRAQLFRTLGYLHTRERRWDDARAAFDQAAAANGDEPSERRSLDLSRMYLVMEAYTQSIADAERGLAAEKLWHSTKDELRDALERALSAADRRDEALAVLDSRAADQHFSLSLHHRCAREYLARHDAEGAGNVLERASNMVNILGDASTHDERLAAVFDPIIAELSASGGDIEGAYLEALLDKIRGAN
ncbi:MAG TPA: SMI1/KNR4 family protein [Kofleriaceae bacterium]